jgi:hypothetical protein
MPPHCDTMDGPVVGAARGALEAEDVNFALAYVPESGEAEVRSAFEKVLRARKADPAAREVADLYFFEYSRARPSCRGRRSLHRPQTGGYGRRTRDPSGREGH